MGIKVKDNQSIFDIAIQYSGIVEAAYNLAFANGVNITDALSGMLQSVSVENSLVVNYYEAQNLIPASFSSNDSTEGVFSEQFNDVFS